MRKKQDDNVYNLEVVDGRFGPEYACMIGDHEVIFSKLPEKKGEDGQPYAPALRCFVKGAGVETTLFKRSKKLDSKGREYFIGNYMGNIALVYFIEGKSSSLIVTDGEWKPYAPEANQQAQPAAPRRPQQQPPNQHKLPPQQGGQQGGYTPRKSYTSARK